MLHARRRRLAELAAREADGEVFWSEEFPEPLRVRLVHLIHSIPEWEQFAEVARLAIMEEIGLFHLTGANLYPSSDFERYILYCVDDMVPTAIEALSMTLGNANIQNAVRVWEKLPMFTSGVNDLLREYRVSYELNGGEMVPFSSRELHVAVVDPALRLLTASPRWEGVERSYRKALEALSRDDAAGAVTDAGTALQEALILLGCSGNALGPLIKSARSKALFTAHDARMLDAIDRVLNWVSADRSNTGDAHNATPAAIEDAWLTIHIVGAVLVRLGAETPRPGA